MAFIIPLGMLLGTGALGLYLSSESMRIQKNYNEANEPQTKTIQGYCEPSHEVVDPQLIRSDVTRHPIDTHEDGPFGCPRHIHKDIGGYVFPTFGQPVMWRI